MAANLSLLRDTSSPAEAMFGAPKSSEGLSLDANAALIDLEKGLRSGKVGEQCEAIVRFPALFERYPFPILVNSAFLKLSEVFRGGTNFMKLCVLKVIQRSSKHLDKVLNVDEFSKRIYSVIHSNDPVARAITLRVFGFSSAIIADKKNIHHSIRSSLDSHDKVEVEAAIFATKKFCKQSWSFAEGIYNKIMDMIEGLSTPIEMKLKLIPIFQFIHKDIDIANKGTFQCTLDDSVQLTVTCNKIHEKCSALLKDYPSISFVCITLHTLSSLSLAALLNIPSQVFLFFIMLQDSSQVSLLISYLESDPRGKVKVVALQDMQRLANEASHLWNRSHVQALIKFATETPSDKLQQRALVVLYDLTQSSHQRDFWREGGLKSVEDLTNTMNVETSSLALAVMSNVIAKSAKDQDPCQYAEEYQQIQLNIQLLISLSIAEESLSSLKRCLSCVKQVLNLSDSTRCNLVDFLCCLIPTLSGWYLTELCRCLATSSALYHKQFQQHLPMLTRKVKETMVATESKDDKDSLVALITLLFQLGFNNSDDVKEDLQNELIDYFKFWNAEEYWSCYRIVRQAARLGYPTIASKLCSMLANKVASENLFYWLKSLCKFQEAEAKLRCLGGNCSLLLSTLMDTNCLYHEGLVNLKASVTQDNPFTFQCAFGQIRANMLQAYAQLLTCCASIKTSPPPAIAMGVSIATGQEVHKLSRLAPQFQDCIERFTAVGDQCGKLLRSSFNADPRSLKNIEVLQESCQTISYAIHILVINRQETRTVSPIPTAVNVSSGFSPIDKVSAINNRLLKSAEELAFEVRESPLSNQQGQFLCQAVISQLQVPCLFPLYYFKSLQNTVIQLSVSPSNKSVNEPVHVNLENHFVLTVEGVMSNSGKQHRDVFRTVSSVCLEVTVKPVEKDRAPLISNTKVTETNITLRQTVKTHNDYFNSQFLIDFTTACLHNITVTASVIDSSGSTWETGPTTYIRVDVFEHGAIKRSSRLN